MNIVIIGLGGIGNCLILRLCQFLCVRTDVSVTLIDGDEFEPDNRTRQYFQQLGNKAEVTKNWLEPMFPEIFFEAIPEYAGFDNLPRLVYNGNIIFLCVDNHYTRKLASEHCENLADAALFSGGNELEHGNVQIFIRKEGNSLTLPLTNAFHPEIADASDMHPRAPGCMAQLPARPQLVFANQTAASIMLNAFYGFLQNQDMPDEIYFDVRSNSTRPVRRTPKEKP